MTNAELQYTYMLNHVRLHSVSDPVRWGPHAVIQCFHMLPAPAVEFAQWKASIGEMGITDEDQAKSNTDAAAFVKLNNQMED